MMEATNRAASEMQELKRLVKKRRVTEPVKIQCRRQEEFHCHLRPFLEEYGGYKYTYILHVPKVMNERNPVKVFSMPIQSS